MKFLKGVTIPNITSSILKTDSSGNIVAATSNTDYAPSSGATFTGTTTTGTLVSNNIRGQGTVFFTALAAGGVSVLRIDGSTGQITQATDGSDYISPTSLTSNLAPYALIASPTFTGTVTIPTLHIGSLNGILEANSGVVGTATSGTDYVAPSSGIACCGRLTLTTGVAVTTSDVTSATTLYFSPYLGNTIALYNTTNSSWDVMVYTEKNISVSGLTANTMYDIFANYANNGTFTLSGTAWTNVTTRATALVLQDGVYCLTGALNKRYLGTVFVGSGSITFDAVGARWVWNRYNRVARKFEAGDSSNSSYTLVGSGGGTWQYTRNNVNNVQCSFVIGQVNENVWISCSNYASIPTGGVYVGTGVNISFNSASTTPTISNGIRLGGQTGALQGGGMINANYIPPNPGLVLLTQLEYAENGTVTFFPGANTSNFDRSAITGTVWS